MEPDPKAFSPGSTRAGINRIRFLLESLVDLDLSLKKLGSRLLVFKGEPSQWDVKKLCFEYDTDPYYQALDIKVKDYASSAGIEVFSPVSHTLFNPEDIIQKNGGKPPLSYQSFVKVAGQPSWASSPISTTISSLPCVGEIGSCEISKVPTVEELGYEDIEQCEWTPFRGGESEALKRLRESINNKEWVANFEKPKGDPSAFVKPATTVLSPYLKFGCLSSRYFYQCLQDVYKNVRKHTSPPVSLVGQIPWNDDNELLAAWREARTGYPWIDAIMVQMKSSKIKWCCADQYNRIYSPLSLGRNGAVKKRIEDVMPIATGHEREELEAELQGKDVLEINHPVGPFGTKEAPAVVKSYYDKRIVGCPGGEGEDEHDVVWFWLEKGKPHECPVCSQYFVGKDVLEINHPVGPFGTKEAPAVVKSYYDKRIVGCPGGEGAGSRGPGGPPDGHGDDEDHH
ncbi:hypothetical protein GH714_000180 [Hevea brasiliensis]|uniref:Photolyase/cryptochrome alpha/beta domain-containing protein n=1 Tax=Hevea brasiliensis TaxID=3981 RepID=A0A6A6L858_HEVBR|nr:hypothetical protein GH714_000180 [Hevea brasiliensis]